MYWQGHRQPPQPPRSLPAGGEVLPATGRERVLLVEDDEVDARVMTLALGALGFVVTRVASLAQATARLVGERFDLVLLDLNLPDTHAASTLLTVEGVARQAPVVVVSGDVATLDVLRRRRGRTLNLLDKEAIDLGLLSAVVRRALV